MVESQQWIIQADMDTHTLRQGHTYTHTHEHAVHRFRAKPGSMQPESPHKQNAETHTSGCMFIGKKIIRISFMVTLYGCLRPEIEHEFRQKKVKRSPNIALSYVVKDTHTAVI